MRKRWTALYYRMLLYQPESLAQLRKHFSVIELPTPAHDSAAVLRRVEVLFAPLGYYVGPDKIDAAKRLKVIVSNTTGHPHIDVSYARKKG